MVCPDVLRALVSIDDRNFYIHIKNQGVASAGMFYVAYYIDGVKLGETIKYSLGFGATTYCSFSWKAVEGDHTVKAVADSTGVVVEENEDNNVIEKPFYVSLLQKVQNLFDLNNDSIVNIADVALVAGAYGSDPISLRWNPIADLNGDCAINILDVASIAKSMI